MQTQITQILRALEGNHNYRFLKPQQHQKKYIALQDKWCLNLASNDYLSLLENKDFNQRFLESNIFKEHCYFSSASSRLLSGNFTIYTLLEEHLKKLFNKEALLFNSGYHANLGVIGALRELKNVLFIADKSVHASHLDGLKGFKAPNLKRFLHNDIQSLKEILAQNVKSFQAIVILSEGLFSMEGDFAKLKELIALKKQFNNVYLYIDEAHSIGSYGENGLGLCASLGFLEEVDFLILTFGKALASMGACVLCQGIFKEYFVNVSRPLIYSTALPPLNLARTLFVFLELSKLESKRIHLQQLSKQFKMLLQELNLEVLGDYNIISLVLKENKKALYFSNALLQKGYFAPAIKSPSVPKNKALLRFSLCADMEFLELESLVGAIKEIYANTH